MYSIQDTPTQKQYISLYNCDICGRPFYTNIVKNVPSFISSPDIKLFIRHSQEEKIQVQRGPGDIIPSDLRI